MHGGSPEVAGRSLSRLVMGALLLAALTGCGNAPVSGNNDRSGEPITESDEPESRKRARIRIELATGYFDQGQTSVALDQIKQAVIADPTGPLLVARPGLHAAERQRAGASGGAQINLRSRRPAQRCSPVSRGGTRRRCSSSIGR
jgi:hypothetical protein